jgi:hypothetical protein
MHDGVATRDVEIDLVQRDAAMVLEVLLDLHLDVVARQVTAEQVAIVAELI